MGISARQMGRGLRAWQVWSLRPPLRAYIVAVVALGGVGVAAGVATANWRAPNLAVSGSILACSIAAMETTRRDKEPRGTAGRDLQSVWYLAIAVTLPPVYSLLAPAVISAYKLWRVPRIFAYRRVFSHATLGLAYGAASLVFHLSSTGRTYGTGLHALLWAATAAGCGVLAWVINHSLVIGAIRLDDPAAGIRGMYANLPVLGTDLIELCLGVLLSLAVATDPWLMILIVPPLVFCRHHLMQHQRAAQYRLDNAGGVLNAHAWHQEAKGEFGRAVQGRTSLALAMVVIDNFCGIGAAVTDEVRRQLVRGVARILKDHLREQDLIARWFSEAEFAILLVPADRVEAQNISDQLRDHVGSTVIPAESGTQVGFAIRPTVSIGVAVLTDAMLVLADLIRAAASALGQAKSTGDWDKVYVVPGSLAGTPFRRLRR